MTEIKYLPDSLDIKNKKIILRLDLNVPLQNKVITDHTRILITLPFLKNLILRKAKIIVVSHLGRPRDKNDKSLSLIPVFKYLKEKINTNIYFFTGNIDDDLKKKCSFLNAGEIILIDNIRYFKEESDNEENFAKKLASLGDIYINDAFSCSHRKQASIHKITKFIKKSYGGPLLKKEVEAINSIIVNKKKPSTCIIGGSKISTKINVISNLMKSVDNIVIVGAMANNFLIYEDVKIGKSLVEKNTKEIIENIYKEAKENKCKIVIPIDFNVSLNFKGSGSPKNSGEIDDKDIILDIGPKSIKIIEDVIDKSNTVLWNGPAGYFENKNFANGTNAIAKKISENTNRKSLVSIIGGGDTVSAINKIETKLLFSHLSTAGGAFLEFLEGKDLPGLSVLK
jgi:phosphoglycerate kinase|tara:strand:+ start:386 stop:1576 length:1191 start_codon:yes stop_codon:yes gene_type:complete